MSELINYSPDLKQQKIGVRESFESKCTYDYNLKIIVRLFLVLQKSNNVLT
jgi:hypothetical protein